MQLRNERFFYIMSISCFLLLANLEFAEAFFSIWCFMMVLQTTTQIQWRYIRGPHKLCKTQLCLMAWRERRKIFN